MKNQKGITLVALVVTIVVLLILAGVSIAMLSGDNGIITNAKDANAANTEGEVVDRMNLAYNTVRTDIIAKSAVNNNYNATEATTLLNLVKQVAKELGGTGSEVTAPETAAKVATNYTVTYTAAGVITITYSDRYFDGNPYQNIVGTITISMEDATYSMPARQVNQNS